MDGFVDPEKFMGQIDRFNRRKDDLLCAMFSEGFKKKSAYYQYSGQYLDDLSRTEVYDNIFRKSDHSFGIFERLRYLAAETVLEDARSHNIHAIYNFNDSFYALDPTRIEVVRYTRRIGPGLGCALRKNGVKADVIADIEFIERVPMHVETKSSLGDMIMEYYNDPRVDRSLIEESIRDLRMMQEVEKLHIMFAVGDKVVPVYIGVGSNQPYNLAEKTRRGKNRFYRLDLLDGGCMEQTSELLLKDIPGNELDYLLKNCDFSYGNPMPDGSVISTGLLVGKACQGYLINDDGREFGVMDEGRYMGSFQVEKGGLMRKIKLDQVCVEGDAEEKIDWILRNRQTGTRLVEKQLLSLFPAFERYAQVFYDPFRLIHDIGVMKVMYHLAKHNLLGSGYLNIHNVASDLYVNGFPAEKRMRGIALLAMNYIRHGKLDELVQDTVKGVHTKPL